MTIVAAVKSRDALVIGTDSMTQIFGGTPPMVLKTYSNATKLFRLGSLHIAVATFGAGNIGHQSIGGIVTDYAMAMTGPPLSMQEVADGLATFVGTRYDAAFSATPANERPTLGFLVGGFSGGQSLAELWEVGFPSAPGATTRTAIMRKPDDFGANWRGITIPFTRLQFGYDPRAFEMVAALGLAAKDVTAVQQALSQFQSTVLFDSMPIQDAIDFAKHILTTTISVSTFEPGTPSCGGPLQIAAVLRRQGFEWVEEPRFHV